MTDRVTRYNAPRAVTPGRRFSPEIELKARQAIDGAAARIELQKRADAAVAAQQAQQDPDGGLSPAAALNARTQRRFDARPVHPDAVTEERAAEDHPSGGAWGEPAEGRKLSPAEELNARSQGAFEARQRRAIGGGK